MSIRKKILLYFSIAVVLLTGIAFFFVYILFSQYREEEFQQRQKDKITTTLNFLTQAREMDEDLIQTMDKVTIHHLYDEKLLIFNKDKRLIYSSVDDTPIPVSTAILESLSTKHPWIEKKDGLYDVVGVYLNHKSGEYYGISKAFDISGYKKIRYLKYILLLTFFGISAVIGLVSYFLSKKITRSIVDLTGQIKDYDFNNRYIPLSIEDKNDEIHLLARRFNELMKKLNDAFSFQKHAIHHISHELKTPIAILVSNFERIEKETEKETIVQLVKHQKESTRNLSEIINSLLEIAKVESGDNSSQTKFRIDEMLFDLAEELNTLYKDFLFSIEYAPGTEDDSLLTITANPRLLQAALMNLMINCIRYSNNSRAKIIITPSSQNLKIEFLSQGATITESEKEYLFQHFFRGENSKDKPGFGLGLVLIDRIIKLHGGSVSYHNEGSDVNIFTIVLPLN
ncbi:sensor histidine kinase [Flavihumibacter solisilvae]|uniref:histidine kinase n=1 Tax=Flavihumibacter solisilvae TaxID=1349421 RepID=A0A0C1LHW1_9BACT|nr:HAMP domain-containing sensor histidine kinase [Flavihumibacter solisilvae]KIC94968.1 histidine kinase [Flavihumibacter solisilvae]